MKIYSKNLEHQRGMKEIYLNESEIPELLKDINMEGVKKYVSGSNAYATCSDGTIKKFRFDEIENKWIELKDTSGGGGTVKEEVEPKKYDVKAIGDRKGEIWVSDTSAYAGLGDGNYPPLLTKVEGYGNLTPINKWAWEGKYLGNGSTYKITPQFQGGEKQEFLYLIHSLDKDPLANIKYCEAPLNSIPADEDYLPLINADKEGKIKFANALEFGHGTSLFIKLFTDIPEASFYIMQVAGKTETLMFESEELIAKSSFSGSYNDLTDKPNIPTQYTHPTNTGNKHIPSGGSANQILRWSADGTAVWGNDNNTTYSACSTSTLGLTKKCELQANSVATTLEELVDDYNSLLAKLKVAGLM